MHASPPALPVHSDRPDLDTRLQALLGQTVGDVATGSRPAGRTAVRRMLGSSTLAAGMVAGGLPARFDRYTSPVATAPATSAAARGAAPPTAIVDQPVDPLGPGFVLDRGRFTTIDVPDAVLETAPFGINSRGQIVGGYDAAGFAVHGFRLDRGRYRTIDFPGASPTVAVRVNARGQVLGLYEDARGGCHGFLLDGGAFTTIDVPRDRRALRALDAGHHARGVGRCRGQRDPSQHAGEVGSWRGD